MYQYYPSGFGNLPIAGATPPQVQPGAAYFVQADPASKQQACPLETGFLIISSAPVYLTFCRLFYLQISAYILSAPARHAVMQCFGHLLIRVHSQPAFAFPHAKAGMMPARVQICIFLNVGLKEAAKREVGTGANQIPDMGAFASGTGWFKLPSGHIVQFGTYSGNTTRFISGNFPIPFPTQPLISISVMSDAVQSNPSGPITPVLSVNFEHISNSSWRVSTSDNSQQYRFSYISIGR